MARRWRRTSLVTAAGLIILLAAILLGRHWLAEQVIVWQLKEAGVDAPSANVRQLDLDSMEITDLRAGDAGRVRRVVITPKGWNLSDWRILVEDIELAATYRDGRLTVDGFPEIARLDGGGGGNTGLPHLTFSDLTLRLAAGGATFTVGLPGEITTGKNDLIRATSPLTVTSEHLRAAGNLNITADQTGATRLDTRIDTIVVRHDGQEYVGGDVTLRGDLQPGFADLELVGSLPQQKTAFSLRLLADAPWDRPVIDARGRFEASDLLLLNSLFPALPAVPGESSIGWSFGGAVSPDRLMAPEGLVNGLEGAWRIDASGRLKDLDQIAADTRYRFDLTGNISAGTLSAVIHEASAKLSGVHPGLVPPVFSEGGDFPLIGDRAEIGVQPETRLDRIELNELLAAGTVELPVAGTMNIRSLADLRFFPGTVELSLDELRLREPQMIIDGPVDGRPAGLTSDGAIEIRAEEMSIAPARAAIDGLTAEAHGLTGTGDFPVGPDTTAILEANEITYGGEGLAVESLSLRAQDMTAGDMRLLGDIIGMTIGATEIVASSTRIHAPDIQAQLTGKSGQKVSELSGRADITGDGSAFEGVVDLAVDKTGSAEVWLEDATVRLPVQYAATAEDGKLTVADGTASLGSARIGQEASLGGPARVAINLTALTGPCTLTQCPFNLDRLDLSVAGGELLLDTRGAGPVRLTRPVLNFVGRDPLNPEARRIAATFELPRIEAEALGRAEGVRVTGPVDPGEPRFNHRISADRVTVTSVPELSAMSFRIDGRAEGAGTDPRFAGRLTANDSALPAVDIAATADRITARLNDASVSSLVSTDLAQPWLPEGFSDAEGRISLDLTYDIESGQTRLAAELSDVGASTDVGAFSGLSGALRTLSLSPFVTDGPQHFTVALVDAGAALQDLKIVVDTSTSEGEPALRIADLSGRMFGGTFRFDPVTVSGERPPEIVLHVDSLSLQELTALAGLEDFRMDGSVSGTVPFAIDQQNRIAIRDARLSADRPGTMQLKLDSLRGAIEQQMGDQADLLLTALEDFHYTVLTADVSKAFGENEQATVRLEGSNPQHLDGQPFIFNISLDSNVVRLADTILALYRATLGEVQALAARASTGR